LRLSFERHREYRDFSRQSAAIAQIKGLHVLLQTPYCSCPEPDYREVGVKMKAIIVALLCSALLTVPANAHNDREVECEKTKQKIKKLESKMRQGYSRAQGERWREQLRELRAVRSKQCR